MTNIGIVEACWPADHDRVLGLFRAYIDELGIDLSFQGVDQELASLPGKYARPNGLVLLARAANADVVGAVAYRSIGRGACEMKRLYMTPLWRGHGIGRLLCVRLLDEARAAGYGRMLLDTGDWLVPALALYRSLGFTEVPAYYHNPISGTVYLARDL